MTAAPPRPRGFRILFVCLVCIGLGQSMLFAILPPAARELGISPVQISIIFATSASFWIFVSPWWGRKSDVWGRRPVVLIGLLGFGLSMALLGTTIALGGAGMLPAALVWPMLIASRCVFALVGSGTGPASQAYVADRTSASERAAGVAFVSAAIGFGETVGPAVGAVLATIALTAPLFFTAALSAVSAAVIWRWLPEEGPVRKHGEMPRRIGWTDRRVTPFLLVTAALQAVRATTVITFALFLQDILGLNAKEAAQRAGLGFVALAASGLLSQLFLIQRFRPTARLMMRAGVPLMLAAFLLLCLGDGLPEYLVALASLGVGVGLVRPGSAAGASLAVNADEQGAVAGLLGGLTVLGNVFGPVLGTSLYQMNPHAPYVLNATIMAAVLAFVLGNTRLRTLRV
ncbi:MAG TPA: MFS transporter [Candidatus Binatia bacterium]|nr:MFS transporter [Candidatus Binatia bacterium]